MSHADHLEISTSERDGLHTIALTGELDLAAVPELEAVAFTLFATATSTLIVDLSGLTFIDSSGIRSILFVQEQCAASGCAFGVVRPPGRAGRLFEIAGLADSLPWVAVPDADDGRLAEAT